MKFNLKNVFLSVGIFAFTLALVGVISTSKVEAAERTASVSGAFGDTATWGGQSVPTSADTIIINADVVVTATAGLGHAGPMTNNGTLTITGGDFTVTDPGAITNNGTISISGSLAGDGAFTNAAGSTLSIGGSATITTLTATASNTVNYTGVAPTCKATTYYNLNFTGSGAITCLATAVTNLATSGTVTWTQGANMAVAGTLTVGAGTRITTGAFTYAVTGITTINGEMVLTANNTKTFTGLVTVGSAGSLTGASTGIVTSAGIANSGTVAITGTDTISTAGAILSGTISIASLTVTAPGTVSNTGTLTIGTALGGNGALTNESSAILNLEGTTTITTLTATAISNLVNYTKEGAQTVKPTSYFDLVLDGSGAKAIGNGTAVAKEVLIDSGVTAALTGSSTTKYLNFNGSRQKSGAWGFTGAAGASHINTTYFSTNSGVEGDITASHGPSTGGSSGGSSSTTPATPATPATPTETPATPATPATPTVEPGCSGGNLFNTSTGAPCVNNTGNANQNASVKTYDFGTTTLKNGSKGAAVMELQRFLNDKLNLGLVVDGKLGPKTIAVIKKWQKDNGLVADGLIGAKTKAKMNASLK